MAKLDLDAQRAEAVDEPHEVTLGGKVYRLQAAMPLEFTQHLNAGRMVEALQVLMVDPSEWDDMRPAKPTDRDLLAIAELYAVDLPESPASPPTSGNGGRSSRRISKGITTSTSRPAASARRQSGSAASTP